MLKLIIQFRVFFSNKYFQSFQVHTCSRATCFTVVNCREELYGWAEVFSQILKVGGGFKTK